MNNKENFYQNCLKGVACILVILNHFHHSNEYIGGIEYTISHLGVPIFYMISGFYLLSPENDLVKKNLIKRVKNSMKLLIIFIAVSLGYQLFTSLVKYHSVTHFFQ